MKKLLATVAALATMSTMAFAERYVMITHTGYRSVLASC